MKEKIDMTVLKYIQDEEDKLNDDIKKFFDNYFK